MPGTLMFECCLHTFRIFLLRMGWVGEKGAVAYQPVPEVGSQLKCRGQVIASTKTVTYEVSVKELGYRPEPYAIANAVMYADDKPVVEVTDMTVRLAGLTREGLEQMWASSALGVGPSALGSLVVPTERARSREAGEGGASGGTSQDAADLPEHGRDESAGSLDSAPLRSASLGMTRRRETGEGVGMSGTRPVFSSAQILAYTNGKPSEAFGPLFKPFDNERILARLPRAPFCFIDQVNETTAEAFVMKAGGTAEAEYFVPPDAWYFDAHRSSEMPFAVLLEIALQPCGWLSCYLGSALTSPLDLSYRNLGGSAAQQRSITRETGLRILFQWVV